MTLVEINNQIIDKFMDDDLISIEDFMKSIKLPANLSTLKKDLINTALKKLEFSGIVTKLEGKEVWVLSQPLKSSGQTIDLSMDVCNEIADVINSYLDANNVKKVRADKLNIAEVEIVMLLNIINEVVAIDPPEEKDDK